MVTEIHRLSLMLGRNSSYLIKEDGLIVVDAGGPNQGKKFRRRLKDLSIHPGDISLILLTHAHWEHIALASEFKQLTGGKVAINQHEKDRGGTSI